MSAPVPILHLLNGERYAGLERVVDHLVAAAPAHGFRLVLGLLKPDRMRMRIAAGELQAHDIPMRSRLDLGVARQAAAVAAQAGCRLLHSHTVRSALIARRTQKLTGLPWLHQVHSPALQESTNRAMNLANHLAESVLLRHADRIVTVSRSLAAHVARHYRIPAARIDVVPNGVACADAPPQPRPEHPTLVLCVGLFRPRKGVEHLVEAAARLRDSGVDCRLRLAGEFADRRYELGIRARIAQLALQDRVSLCGFVTDVAAQLDEAHLLVVPSVQGEGLPMAALEAMARGVPVIASDIDGLRELLENDAGVLVAPADVPALAAVIARLVADPSLRERLGRAGQARQRRDHALEVQHERIFAGYRALTDGPRRNTPYTPTVK
jgi:glycosyltransferase involved in cell wall biosynthesis